MPNWSSCSIKFKSEETVSGLFKLESLFNNIKKHGFNFGTTVVEHKTVDKQRTAWGTKWNMNPNEAYLIMKNNSIIMDFESPWCGPHKWFKTICKEHNLSGSYFDCEQGDNFAHKIEYQNGELELEEENKYFSELSIEHLGIDYFLEDFEFLLEDDSDLSEVDQSILNLFNKHGYTKQDLINTWKGD